MSDDEDEFEEDPMDEDQEFVPAPPSPVVSDVSFESDTSDALGYALESEVAPTFEFGESSAVPPSELRAELRQLREGVTRCQGRFGSMARSTCYRPYEVTELIKVKRKVSKANHRSYVGAHEHAAKLRAVEDKDVELHGYFESLKKRMTQADKELEQIEQSVAIIDARRQEYDYSIEELWGAVHAMQWDAYYERMERFRFSDRIDVLAVYGRQSERRQ